jgi:glycerate kinase
MKVVIALDSFKGSLTSLEAGAAAAEGVRRAMPDAEVRVRPLADGGEGTVEALCRGLGGQLRTVRVEGPLGDEVDCAYGILPGGETAVIEMAGAAGLPLVPADRRDPMRTSTYGVGQVISDAVSMGCRRFIVGIGGSATNDGGAGMLQALGFSLEDAQGAPIPRGAKGLERLRRVDGTGALPALAQCRFRVACDVTNPLCGPNGASAIYGPQKGATPETIPLMDRWLGDFARLAGKSFPRADALLPGTGAAGGLGFAFHTFLGAELQSGIRIVLEETHLEEELAGADVVITGEGRLDGQTAMGKAPVGVAQLAKRHGCLTVALAGAVTPDAAACNDAGIDAFFPIVRGAASLSDAMQPARARQNLSAAAEQVFRLLAAAR